MAHSCLHRIIILATILASLSGCMGGTVAQQIASSIATRVADNAVATAVENKEKRDAEEAKRAELSGNAFGEYWAAFATSGFESVTPIQEPLPAQTKTERNQVLETKLVRVELINLLAGEEKSAILYQAQLHAKALLPDSSDLSNWRVGTGIIPEGNTQSIVFLIPPELGKLPSGSITMVEISPQHDIYVARYVVN